MRGEKGQQASLASLGDHVGSERQASLVVSFCTVCHREHWYIECRLLYSADNWAEALLKVEAVWAEPIGGMECMLAVLSGSRWSPCMVMGIIMMLCSVSKACSQASVSSGVLSAHSH